MSNINRTKNFISRLLQIVPRNLLRQILDLATKALSRKSGTFITFSERPSYAQTMPLEDSTIASTSDCAILIQGQYIEDSNFTIETLSFYRKLYPKHPIVLSTWVNEVPQKDRYRIETELNIKVLENVKPEHTGVLNLNLQMATTKTGLDFISSELKTPNVLKTRTDQRIYQYNLFTMLNSFSDTFGRNKLTALTFNSKKNILGSISDMFLFGKCELLQSYFSVPEQKHSISRAHFFANKGKYLNPEQYLYESYTGSIPSTYELYKKDIAQHFILIDKESVDLYWHKYSNLENKKYYNTLKEDINWTFADYLEIFYSK